jgi:hypothetical protein
VVQFEQKSLLWGSVVYALKKKQTIENMIVVIVLVSVTYPIIYSIAIQIDSVLVFSTLCGGWYPSAKPVDNQKDVLSLKTRL